MSVQVALNFLIDSYHDVRPYDTLDLSIMSMTHKPVSTYQSMIRIFLQVSAKSSWHTFAAIDTLSNMQNPIGLLHSAWCPGGLMTAIAFFS